MLILKLAIVFAVVMAIVAMKKPMSFAVVVGSIVTWVLYGLPTNEVLVMTYNALTAMSTLKVILVMYLITFMQRMMEKRGAIERARIGLSRLFNNRWVNCVVAPICIGMLPSPNAAFIAGDMVSASAGEYLDKGQQAVTTTFFRHITEAFMPTYNAIILALALTGISAAGFVIGMLPMVATLIILGMIFFLKGKVPTETGLEPSENKSNDIKDIVYGVWAIFLDIILIVGFGLDVVVATAIVLVLYFLVNKFTPAEVMPYFLSAFESKIVFNTLAVMTFKELLMATGSLEALPDFFSRLPIPTFLVFVLIFLVGTLVAGSLTMVATVLPIAMATIPGAGLPLVVLLMSTTYVAMQVSPTHICLSIVAEYFNVSLGDIIKRTVPLLCVFMVIAVAYYLGCTMLFAE